MNRFYFTFGLETPYRDNYVAIDAPDRWSARQEMITRFGLRWAFQYDTAESAGIMRFHLTELPTDVPPV